MSHCLPRHLQLQVQTSALRPVYTKRQNQFYINGVMTLATQFSLTTMESLQNKLQTHFKASIDADTSTKCNCTTAKQWDWLGSDLAALSLTLGVNGPLRYIHTVVITLFLAHIW